MGKEFKEFGMNEKIEDWHFTKGRTDTNCLFNFIISLQLKLEANGFLTKTCFLRKTFFKGKLVFFIKKTEELFTDLK